MRLTDVKVSWHDKLREEGREEAWKENYKRGLIEGQRKILLRFALWKFGQLPDELTEHIQAITDEASLEELSKQVVETKSLDDLVIPLTQND